MNLSNMYQFSDLPQYQEFVESYTPEQRKMLVRSYRNGCLFATDWTQLPDSYVDKEPWVLFRQQLRDMMSTYDGTSPDVVFPIAPTL